MESVPEICNGKSDEVPVRVERNPDVGGTVKATRKVAVFFSYKDYNLGIITLDEFESYFPL